MPRSWLRPLSETRTPETGRLEAVDFGRRPVAEIVPEDPEHAPARAELIAACRAALPTYKVPREFRIVAALARTPTGKVQR